MGDRADDTIHITILELGKWEISLVSKGCGQASAVAKLLFFHNRNPYKFNGDYLFIDCSCCNSSPLCEQNSPFKFRSPQVTLSVEKTRLWLSQLAPCFRVLLQNLRPGLHSVCFCESSCLQVITVRNWRGEGHRLPHCPAYWVPLPSWLDSTFSPQGFWQFLCWHAELTSSVREHSTNTWAALGSCLLSVTKELSTQQLHMESRHEITPSLGLRTMQAFCTELKMLGGYKLLFFSSCAKAG